jgi:hypothetical protein
MKNRMSYIVCGMSYKQALQTLLSYYIRHTTYYILAGAASEARIKWLRERTK